MSFVPQSSTIRDALQGQLLDQFDPSQFESQGGMLYLSLNSAINQMVRPDADWLSVWKFGVVI